MQIQHQHQHSLQPRSGVSCRMFHANGAQEHPPPRTGSSMSCRQADADVRTYIGQKNDALVCISQVYITSPSTIAGVAHAIHCMAAGCTAVHCWQATMEVMHSAAHLPRALLLGLRRRRLRRRLHRLCSPCGLLLSTHNHAAAQGHH